MNLREAAQQALEAMDKATRFMSDSDYKKLNQAIEELRAALAEPVQEPVAWRFEARHIDSAWAAAVTLKHPGPEGVYMRNVMPLYTAPPQRKPLTEVELDQRYYVSTGQMLRERDKRLAFLFARAIERAHGIGDSDE